MLRRERGEDRRPIGGKGGADAGATDRGLEAQATDLEAQAASHGLEAHSTDHRVEAQAAGHGLEAHGTGHGLEARATEARATEGRAAGGAPLMVRLFGVPLVIVGLIVGAAVVVVLFFGDIGTEKQQPISSLIEALKQGGGGRTMGVLLPRDKELWQVAQELAQRLRNKERELTAEDLDAIVTDLSAIVRREAAYDPTGAAAAVVDLHEKRVGFMLSALALTGDVRAVEVLVEMLDNGAAAIRRDAVRALAEMHEIDEARAEAPRVVRRLSDPAPVVRTVAAVALSSLASPHDVEVREQLFRACLDDEREVRWNAGLSLARLGDARAKGVLTDLLDRDFWQKTVRLQVDGGGAAPSTHAMPAHVVDSYLKVAIDAAANLNDASLWEQIDVLQRDPSPSVSQQAKTALAQRRPAPAS